MKIAIWDRRHRYFSAGRIAFLAIIYVVGAAVALGANPFKGETTGPFDLLASYEGWQPDTVVVRNRERSDILDSLLPAWIEAEKQIHSGTVPLWNPLPAGGKGLLLDPTHSVMTVGFLMFLLSPDPAFGFYLTVLSSLMLAGLGMHLFVARRCHDAAALFAGISYMMCGFITAWLFWPHTLTAIWIPWLLLAVDTFVRRRTGWAALAIAITTALMFLGGFPFVVAIGLGCALVHAVVVASRQGARYCIATASLVAGAAGLGIALVAVQLLSMWAMLEGADLRYRHGGTPLSIEDAKLLLRPWAAAAPRVETNMYVGMSALFGAVLGIMRFALFRNSPLALSGLIFIAVGACLAFGILPVEWGRALPVLSNNPWNRAILLLDIGIILLAAAGFDALLKRFGSRKLAVVVVGLICVVQAIDLVYQFRRFNGPTLAKYYYAADSNLTLLSDELGPFQYIAQDGHFLISGALGALGLADWFGHSFRSPEMRKMLSSMAEKPFASPTSTSSPISAFRWSSPVMDATATCYGVYTHARGLSPVLLRAPGHDRYAMPAFNDATVRQEVVLPEGISISSVLVRLATYRATGLDGQALLSVYPVHDRKPLIQSSLPGSEIVDNKFAVFSLEQPVSLSGGRYVLELAYEPGPDDKRLTAWVMKAGGGLTVDGKHRDGTLEYLIEGPAGADLEVISEVGNTVIARNRNCLDGPYWTPGTDFPARGATSAAVSILSYIPHDFTLAVDAPAKGYVVVPMRYQPGWRASLSGTPWKLEHVFGVMPAVEVPRGKSVIRFQYFPPRWKLGLMISLSGVIVFFLAWIWRRRRRRREPV